MLKLKTKKAVASEMVYKGNKIGLIDGKEELYVALNAIIPNHLTNDDVVFVCIGTNRSTGDSLGPFVGMYLKGLGYENVYGTIENPVNAINLRETVDNLPKNKIIIAIDSSLGRQKDVGKLSVINGSIKPGAGVGKDLGEVGDYGIHGCVNLSGHMEFFVLQSTPLSRVIKMSKDIVSAIAKIFPLDKDTYSNNAKFDTAPERKSNYGDIKIQSI